MRSGRRRRRPLDRHCRHRAVPARSRRRRRRRSDPTAHTFIATAEAISNVGARPVFADIDPATFNLDPNHVERDPDRTRAILAVHLYGQPADLRSLKAIAERHGLWLIEDAAQAHGSEIDGHRCGSIGDLPASAALAARTSAPTVTWARSR